MSGAENSFRGFYGEYEITVTADGKEYKTKALFTENGENSVTVTV